MHAPPPRQASFQTLANITQATRGDTVYHTAGSDGADTHSGSGVGCTVGLCGKHRLGITRTSAASHQRSARSAGAINWPAEMAVAPATGEQDLVTNAVLDAALPYCDVGHASRQAGLELLQTVCLQQRVPKAAYCSALACRAVFSTEGELQARPRAAFAGWVEHFQKAYKEDLQVGS